MKWFIIYPARNPLYLFASWQKDAYEDRGIQVVMDLPKETKDTGAAPFTLGILNSDRLHNIGWQPQYSLKEGLMRTVQYLENK